MIGGTKVKHKIKGLYRQALLPSQFPSPNSRGKGSIYRNFKGNPPGGSKHLTKKLLTHSEFEPLSKKKLLPWKCPIAPRDTGWFRITFGSKVPELATQVRLEVTKLLNCSETVCATGD